MKDKPDKAKRTKRTKPKIVIVPHYIGTEKADVIFKDIIADEIRKKIDKSEIDKSA